MNEVKKKNNRGKIAGLVIGGSLTIAGIICIPPIIKKYGNKLYKKSVNEKEIDFDNMGPEIVPFDDEKQEEDK